MLFLTRLSPAGNMLRFFNPAACLQNGGSGVTATDDDGSMPDRVSLMIVWMGHWIQSIPGRVSSLIICMGHWFQSMPGRVNSLIVCMEH